MDNILIVMMISLNCAAYVLVIWKAPAWFRIPAAFCIPIFLCFSIYVLTQKNQVGEMNTYVGMPYRDLIQHMHTLSEQGNIIELHSVISMLHSRKSELSSAWLYQTNRNAFRQLVEEIRSNTPTDSVEDISAYGAESSL